MCAIGECKDYFTTFSFAIDRLQKIMTELMVVVDKKPKFYASWLKSVRLCSSWQLTLCDVFFITTIELFVIGRLDIIY